MNGIRGIVYNGQVWHNFKIVRYADYFKKIFFSTYIKILSPNQMKRTAWEKIEKLEEKIEKINKTE